MNKKIIMGVSGDVGSFSEEAAIRYAARENKVIQLNYLMDMDGVLSALDTEKIDLGIFPVVNIHGGLVKPAFEAMGKYSFKLIDELWLDVKQCLLALPGTNFNDIKAVASHPQGYAQCKNYLKNKLTNAEFIPWIDTAKAAKDLREGKLSVTTAVIAPESSAAIYQLEVMDKNIQDQQPNLTAFIIVKRYK